MCPSGINQCLVKMKTTPDTLVERKDITEAEKNIPRDKNPPSTPAPLICSLRETNSLFIQHLLEGLLASATSPTCRPSDVSAANAYATEAPATSSSHTDSSASDSDNDSNVLATVFHESDSEHRKDALLKTKHEKDENKIYISRPEFVATEQHTLVKVGTISGILDNAVIVTTFNLTEVHPSLPNADITTATALDTGSLLCFPDGTLLGAVFETFGPVASPLYVVRFNTSDEIPSATQVGQEIMYVEQEMCVVRARDVCRKGYDASGKDDEEADAEEFSDDEKERRAKKLKRSGITDRTAGPLKRKRGPRERQRQRRPERPPLRTKSEFHRSTRFCVDEHERHWAGQSPHGSNQHNMKRSKADEVLSLRAHRGIQTPTTLSQPNFITQGAPCMPLRYPTEVPVYAPSITNLAGTRGSSFNSRLADTGYAVPLQPSPFSAPATPFSDQMVTVRHQQLSYSQSWGPQANYGQYEPNRHLNPTQPPYHDMGQPTPMYAAVPSHPYHNYEHRPSGALNRDSLRELHRDAIPNPNIDAEGWQRTPRQYHHM